MPLSTSPIGHRPPKLYSLEIVLEVGKRIGSENGNSLREWLEDYLGKAPGETMIAYHAGGVSIDVWVSPSEETVWLTQGQIAELFEVTQQNISLHLKAIQNEGELDDSVHKYYLYTASDGK